MVEHIWFAAHSILCATIGFLAFLVYSRTDLGEAAWWRSCYEGLSKNSDRWETRARFRTQQARGPLGKL